RSSSFSCRHRCSAAVAEARSRSNFMSRDTPSSERSPAADRRSRPSSRKLISLRNFSVNPITVACERSRSARASTFTASTSCLAIVAYAAIDEYCDSTCCSSFTSRLRNSTATTVPVSLCSAGRNGSNSSSSSIQLFSLRRIAVLLSLHFPAHPYIGRIGRMDLTLEPQTLEEGLRIFLSRRHPFVPIIYLRLRGSSTKSVHNVD